MVYIFDTSSFKVLGNYFPKSFPTVWQKIDLLVSEGKLQSVREVLKEVEYGNNKQFVLDWIDFNKQIFLPPTAQKTLFIAEIFSISNFKDLVSSISYNLRPLHNTNRRAIKYKMNVGWVEA